MDMQKKPDHLWNKLSKKNESSFDKIKKQRESSPVGKILRSTELNKNCEKINQKKLNKRRKPLKADLANDR